MKMCARSLTGGPVLRLMGKPMAVPQRPFRVLLTDDKHHHHIPLLRALREQGHCVLYAADGVSAETLCRTPQLEIDVLVACAEMKRMDGSELARRVVRMRPEVRGLFMWRHFVGPEVAHRVYEHGYAVIEEPFTPEELCRRLTGLLTFPRNEACADSRFEGKDPLVVCEDEALAIGSKKNRLQRDLFMEQSEVRNFSGAQSEIV